MARLARLVIPGMPHHVTQRGNRRHQTFFNEEDYAACLELTPQWRRQQGVAIWGYCLMPSHRHLIAVPGSEQGLGARRKKRAPETMFGGLAVNQDGSPSDQTGRTFSALGPFGLWPSSYSTVWPG